MTINGNDSAYPQTGTFQPDWPGTGLSKREYFAAMAMQGLVASVANWHSDVVGAVATQHADGLIAALNAPICPDCKRPTTDGHYDAEHNICPDYERAVSEQA